jgi:hypothetical protein
MTAARIRRTALAITIASTVVLGACFDVQEYADFQLNISPFENTYLDRGEATMEIWLMPGYFCPDGELARLYVVYGNHIETPAPLALVLHEEPFDYLRSDGTSYSSQFDVERLTADWGALATEKMLGMHEVGGSAYKPGALIAELVREDFYVLAPTNCWGDLWHSTGDNDYTEGFLRYGLYVADDALTWGLDNLEIDEERVLLAGMGEGGRGVMELARPHALGLQTPMLTLDDRLDLRDVGILIDSSPDYLPPIFGDPNNAEFIDGLEKIYGAEQLSEEDFKTLLGTHSLSHIVGEGFVAPTMYIYSANDDFVDVSLSRPAKNAIESEYPAGMYYPEMEMSAPRHIITNTTRSEAENVLDWLIEGWDQGF